MTGHYYQNPKDEALLNSLLGHTVTIVNKASADVGYYELETYMVIHFMPDPLRSLGCFVQNCSELENKVCQNNNNNGSGGDGTAKTCIDTETNIAEWSDGKNNNPPSVAFSKWIFLCFSNKIFIKTHTNTQSQYSIRLDFKLIMVSSHLEVIYLIHQAVGWDRTTSLWPRISIIIILHP